MLIAHLLSPLFVPVVLSAPFHPSNLISAFVSFASISHSAFFWANPSRLISFLMFRALLKHFID